MSPQEHYFENLVCAFARLENEGYNNVKKHDSNPEYFGQDVKEAIEICAVYVIDICNWDKEKVTKLLKNY